MTSNEQLIKILKIKKIKVPKLIEEGSILLKTLWILKICKDNTSVSALPPKGISDIAHDILDEDIKRDSIIKALSRAGNKVKSSKGFYEIMRPGRKELQQNEEKEKRLILITGEKPWTDRNEFINLLKKLSGDIFILDPYYGIETFHVLSKFPDNNKIKLLTSQLGRDEKEELIKKECIRFKKEFKNIKISIYPKFYELHDRYIISDNYFIIIGHGIKDIGNKECFLIALPLEEVLGLIKPLKKKFEERWKKAHQLI